MLNSSTFFPLAVWLQQPKNAQAYRQLGINLYVGLLHGPTETQLLTLKQTGMPVICPQTTIGLKDKNSDIIVGWMQSDEPDNKQGKKGRGYDPPVSPEEIVSRYVAIRHNDPSRPVFLNFGQGVAWDQWEGRGERTNHLEDYPKYIKGGDILSFDIYPVTHRDPEVQGKLEYVAKGVERLKSWASSKQRVWNVIGLSGINNSNIRPTPGQIRSQVWMSIIHGSKGIVYFVHQFKPKFVESTILHDKKMQKEVLQLNKRITFLAPVLNSPNTDDILKIDTTSSKTKIAAISKRYKCSMYLLSVGMSKAEQSGRFKFRHVIADQLAEVIDEKRTVAVKHGVLQDHFAPYEPHLYRLDVCHQ